MSLLYRIIYAAHANGTHHKLALDALALLKLPKAETWRNVFLKHASLYLEGSKAPDNSFKDFKNHVLHVRDGYWGGAPEKVQSWYTHTVTALREERWADAAYAAGVLSHYYTDPIHPFHTAQTEAENAIHRAVEWSINRSYDKLKAIGDAKYSSIEIELPTGDLWLRELVCDGADFANRHYEKLIAHYDFKRGVVAPEEGLNEIAQTAIAELIRYASTGFARLLEQAIADSAANPPDVTLTLDTLIATLQIPRKALIKKLTNASERRIVEAMYDELQATGRVEQSLPEDDKIIRDLYQREVLDPRAAKEAEVRAERIPAGDPGENARKAKLEAAAGNGIAPAASAGSSSEPQTITFTAQPSAATVSQPTPIAEIANSLAQDRVRRSYLAESDELERAPSIGPKLADQFASIGIATVGQFLAADPDETAAALADRRVDATTIEEWQDQARLVIQVAGLRGTQAQLLTGAGYRTIDAIANADPINISADVLNFASTSDGKRILREGHAPDIEKIKLWVEAAADAAAAAA